MKQATDMTTIQTQFVTPATISMSFDWVCSSSARPICSAAREQAKGEGQGKDTCDEEGVGEVRKRESTCAWVTFILIGERLPLKPLIVSFGDVMEPVVDPL